MTIPENTITTSLISTILKPNPAMCRILKIEYVVMECKNSCELSK